MGMNLESIAILGVVIFAFIALAHGINTARSIRRLTRDRSAGRPRRPIAGEAAARQLAESIVREVAAKHEDEAAETRAGEGIPAELEEALEKAREHYCDRVERRHRALFHRAVDSVLLDRAPERNSGIYKRNDNV
jgi:biopolymer transport protein ExbB/TolQ